MPDLFAVIFHKDLRLEVPAVAAAVSAALQVNIYDARHLARYARGVVAEELSHEDADSLTAALAALGIPAAVIPQSRLPVLPPVRRVQSIDCATRALGWKMNLQQDAWLEIPWSNVIFVSVGVVASPHYKDFVTSDKFKSVPMLRHIDDPAVRKEVKERLATRHLRKDAAAEIDLSTRKSIEDDELKTLYREQTRSYCDILVTDPVQRLRIDRHDCHFDSLGPRMKQTSLENFRLLVEDLTKLATAALFTDITRAYLDGIELHRILFDSISELDRYEVWTLHRAGTPPPAPPLLPPAE